MPLDTSVKISKCLAHIAKLRERARADADPASKAELRDLELQWMAVVDGYQMVEQSDRFLKDLCARRSAPKETQAQTAGTIWPTSRRVEASPAANGASLADLLEVLVCTAIEHAHGNARAAFYLADPAGLQLHHVIGMPDAYARCVNGFTIGTHSLACGLAAATGHSVITPDVSKEPRWQPWLWLAERFNYRACWSFPVVISSGKVLGSFEMYYKEPREAAVRDIDLASVLTRTAATIIHAASTCCKDSCDARTIDLARAHR
jgi:hypothetical protein